MNARASASGAHRRAPSARMPSTAGYMIAAAITAAALFFVLWWMLQASGDESPWVPAGLAASVVMLVAVAAREVVMRRAWTRYLLEQDQPGLSNSSESRKYRPSRSMHGSRPVGNSVAEAHAAQFRAIQKQSADVDSLSTSTPETHLDLFNACKDYLTSTDETLRSVVLSPESRSNLRISQERVRALKKHHLLSWARGASQSLVQEAQRRVLYGDKIETARRALDCLDSALKLYPEETELNKSALALREYIVSMKVGRWVEMAERAAFKGKFRRAIDRYCDALFYLSREEMDEAVRAETAERIGREIEMLRARISTVKESETSSEERADGWSVPES